MEANASRDWMHYFDNLEDLGMERTRLHRLKDLIAIAIVAVTCGADGWGPVAPFGRAKHDWLKRMRALPHGIPVRTPSARSSSCSPSSCSSGVCLLNWIESLVELTGAYASHIDDKMLGHNFRHGSVQRGDT